MSDKFIKYQYPKLGVFSINKKNGKWTINGWETIDKKAIIIGEDSISYVYNIRQTCFPYSYEGLPYEVKTTIYVGYHKSRLVRWIDNQLSLF